MKIHLLISMICLSGLQSCLPVYPPPEIGGYRRIMVVGQSSLNLLLELGLQERIVGIAYLEDLSLLKGYKVLPVLTTGWPDKETILSLKPDLIFGMEAALGTGYIGNYDFWEKRGIRVFTMDDYRGRGKNFPDYFSDIHAAGMLFNIQNKADSLIANLQELRHKYQKQSLPHKRILHLSHLSGKWFYYYPPSLCLLDEIVEDCGGEYINWGNKPFIFPIETILESNPDKIIITRFRKGKHPDFAELLYRDEYLRYLPAVHEKKIIEINYTQSIRGTTNMEEVYSNVFKFLQND